MSLAPAQAHEAYIGPSSEPIQLSAFLDSARHVEAGTEERRPLPVFAQSSAALPKEAREVWTCLSADEQESIKAECRVDDLRTILEDTIHDPRLMGHVTRTHEASVYAIYETAEPTKRKRKRPTLADPAQEIPEVTALREKHEAIKLKCWPLTMRAAPFIRPPRQPDHNTLIYVKQVGTGPTSEANSEDALVFVTIYTRVSWGQKIPTRASQHVLLASQTLGDLFEAIPCASNELPEEIRDESGKITGFTAPRRDGDMEVDRGGGAVICIEDVLYGDGQSQDDYADKVVRLVQSLPESKRGKLAKGPSMHDTKLSSLTIRLHEPYWILHAGNCEHFFSISSVRLRHPSDPQAGYPLTTQITPPLLDFCRVCTKVPAVYSIVGDIRLGESPFLICAPCWRGMGEPKDGAEVLVVPLPKHELGWTTG
ncbi:hypothetical protein K466DRAFT_477981 [Polyporus arcularius HHB13444]|uniref:snRNA-activating protein complex subunit 3 n=1 Tax=Polyporus arcularius HHB13444 TaxID=1314778 RepID=A0A5C3PVV0_9APHY|nr:hypothetical protein K466DRAFT_477981 [Polyporus arcularius HHB13444]